MDGPVLRGGEDESGEGGELGGGEFVRGEVGVDEREREEVGLIDWVQGRGVGGVDGLEEGVGGSEGVRGVGRGGGEDRSFEKGVVVEVE